MAGLVVRRTLLRGALALGAAGVGAGTGMIADVLPGGSALRRVLGVTSPDGEIPDVPPVPVRTERMRSAARGRTVELVTMAPAGEGPDLPLCLALHGRGSGARRFLDLGVPRFLAAAVRSGVPPFAIVAVDCGDSYYLPRKADDPQRMLTEELPAWLGERGRPAPVAALGISMGGFGALCLAAGMRAVAVASPALFPTWTDAKGRNAFHDERQWAEHEPLRHTDRLAGVPLGVWCGTEDLRVLPELLTFVGRNC